MRDANYEPDRDDDPALFAGAAPGPDRDLIDARECAALAGCSIAQWDIGVQTGMYPNWEGYPDLHKCWHFAGTRANGRPRFEFRKLWRRGLVITAVERVHGSSASAHPKGS